MMNKVVIEVVMVVGICVSFITKEDALQAVNALQVGLVVETPRPALRVKRDEYRMEKLASCVRSATSTWCGVLLSITTFSLSYPSPSPFLSLASLASPPHSLLLSPSLTLTSPQEFELRSEESET
eukprot:759969-Hanusia_phi.AAC.4